jgi:HAD superfamily hydrolase (TIGR01484 family)
MRYYALATDYDGTLAHDGEVDAATLAALQRLKQSGRHLVMVTGRELDDLARVFPHLHLFDRIVAENGAQVFNPATGEETLLGERPPEAFIQHLREKKVEPLSVGRVIVATWEPNEVVVLEAIRDFGLEHQVIFNKGAVMILPPGVNKATGLETALAELGLSRHNVVAVGDAENDHAFLRHCECAAVVANALDSVKAEADYLTPGARGAGVADLIHQMLADDLAAAAPNLQRHALPLGVRAAENTPVAIPPYGTNVLLTGMSGSGKSTIATSFVERLDERGYQYCIIDPEGDYPNLENAAVIGGSDTAPTVEEVIQILENPAENVVVNLLGISLENRPAFFDSFWSALQALRARCGRPHWLLLDEAHHLLPDLWQPAPTALPQQIYGLMLITVHPQQTHRRILEAVDLVITVGSAPGQALETYCEALDATAPAVPALDLQPGEAMAWWRHSGQPPVLFEATPPRVERHRHVRKYAQGELGEDSSFYFRGPDNRLNLRAQNLNLFVQLAEGVDDATWLYHLRRHDYSHWMAGRIKDPGLAQAVAAIEADAALSPADSRRRIKQEIQKRYAAVA